MKIVLASSNAAKLNEIKTILADPSINLIPQSEFNLVSPQETGLTFVENALIKARYACKKTNLPAISDDSGLVVEALNGAPGIYSSRFAGKGCNDLDNINKIINLIQEHSLNNLKTEYKAYYYCVTVFLATAEHPCPIICSGKLHGTIIIQPKGNSGFGYDPIFYLSEYGKTIAELNPALKNTISHRAEALHKLKAYLNILDLES